MRFFSPVERWLIPESAWAESLREMARDGQLGNEGIALWLGRRGGGQSEVTHVLALRGSRIVKRPDLLVVDASLLNDVTDLAVELNVALVGQIHSHGEGYGTHLSPSDRQNGVRIPGYLSIVAPGYGLVPNTRIDDCGVHVFAEGGGFRRYSPAEVSERVMVSEGLSVPVLIVGKE